MIVLPSFYFHTFININSKNYCSCSFCLRLWETFGVSCASKKKEREKRSFWFPNLSTGPTNEAKYSVLSRCTCPKYLNKWWEMSVSCREGPTLSGKGRLSSLTSPVVTQHAAGMFRLRLSPHLWFLKTRLSWMPVCLWPGRREDAKQSTHRPWFRISLLPPTPPKNWIFWKD